MDEAKNYRHRFLETLSESSDDIMEALRDISSKKNATKIILNKQGLNKSKNSIMTRVKINNSDDDEEEIKTKTNWSNRLPFVHIFY